MLGEPVVSVCISISFLPRLQAGLIVFLGILAELCIPPDLNVMMVKWRINTEISGGMIAGVV